MERLKQMKSSVFTVFIMLLLVGCQSTPTMDTLTSPVTTPAAKTTDTLMKPVGATANVVSRGVAKTTGGIISPIVDTTDDVFRERKIGADGKTQAVIFPRDEEETNQGETKQFKLSF